MKKTIAVTMATGGIGLALANAVFEQGHGSQFALRAFTRDPTSERADKLRQLGCEVVKVDPFDREALAQALDGCYGLWASTFTRGIRPESDLALAESYSYAAKQAGIKHVIWLSFDDTRQFFPNDSQLPDLFGNYKVPHFDAKNEAEKYFQGIPVTFFSIAFWWDSLLHINRSSLMDNPKGGLQVLLPFGDKRLAGVAIDDIGRCILGCFKDDSLIGQRISISSEFLTLEEMTKQLSEVLGKQVTYVDIDSERFRKIPFPGADAVTNMFCYWRDFNERFCDRNHIEIAKRLNPKLMTFKQWCQIYKTRFQHHTLRINNNQ